MQILIEPRITPDLESVTADLPLQANTTLVRLVAQDDDGRQAIAFVNAMRTPRGVWFQLVALKPKGQETCVSATATIKVPRS
jgi:hypothetical protein